MKNDVFGKKIESPSLRCVNETTIKQHTMSNTRKMSKTQLKKIEQETKRKTRFLKYEGEFNELKEKHLRSKNFRIKYYEPNKNKRTRIWYAWTIDSEYYDNIKMFQFITKRKLELYDKYSDDFALFYQFLIKEIPNTIKRNEEYYGSVKRMKERKMMTSLLELMQGFCEKSKRDDVVKVLDEVLPVYDVQNYILSFLRFVK